MLGKQGGKEVEHVKGSQVGKEVRSEGFILYWTIKKALK